MIAVFRERCPRCDAPSDAGYCAACRRDFLATADPCARCALPRPVRSCPRQRTSWLVERVHAPYLYTEPLRSEIAALKYRGVRKLGRALALLVHSAAAEFPECDALVAVPIDRSRRRSRGYNQAAEIARTLAREIGCPLLSRGILRHSGARAQTGMSASARARNLAGSFRVAAPIAGSRLMIVDDVLTTGATVNALAQSLLAAGARSAHVCAVARTPESEPRTQTR